GQDAGDTLTDRECAGPGLGGQDEAGGAVGGMGLRPVAHDAAGGDRRQLLQRFGRGVVHALVGVDDQGAAPAALDRDRDHPRPLEGPVVGQRLPVLLVAHQRQVVDLRLGEARLGGYGLGGGDHRRAARGVALERVQHPALDLAASAGLPAAGVDEDGPVAGAVGGHGQHDGGGVEGHGGGGGGKAGDAGGAG